MTDADRIPPSNLEAEIVVLGAMMANPEFVDVVAAQLAPSDFYALMHEFFAERIFALHDAGKPIDTISLAEATRDDANFDRFGGLAFLRSCAEKSSYRTTADVAYYAGLVAEKAKLRRLIAAGDAIMRIGFDGEADIEAALGLAQRAFDRATEGRGDTTGGTSMTAAMTDVYQEIERAQTGESAARALMTPWEGINTMTGGFFPGELVAIPSAPAQGKTSMVLTLADYIGAKYGLVAFCSFEMTKRALSRRLLAMHSNISARNQRLGAVSGEQWGRIAEATSTIARRNIRLFGREAASLSVLRRELRALKREMPIRAIVVDHVGFIADVDADSARTTKHERLDRVYRRLLEFAEEFETTIFAVQHVNRAGMGQRPTMQNIRDGGNIEGHAHAIIFPYRPHALDGTAEERCQGEFIVAKCRDGEEGIVPMYLRGWRHLWTQTENDQLWFDDYSGVA